MKTRLLSLALLSLLLSSCHTPDEKIAIDYIKKHCKSPSSFHLLEVESQTNYIDAKTKIDTIFWKNGVVQYDTSKRSLGTSLYDYKFDSISYIIKTTEPHTETWVNVSFEATNSFGASIKNFEYVIVENGRAYTLIDYAGKHEHKTRQGGEKFKKKQITKRPYQSSL